MAGTLGLWRQRAVAVFFAGLLAGCTGFNPGDLFPSAPVPMAPAPSVSVVPNTGAVRVGLLLPLSAGGNAAAVGQAMRNAADLAIAEFNATNLQVLVKDDAGTAGGAYSAARQAIDDGAEVLLGPLFAHSVTGARQAARSRGVSVIAFSTDTNAAGNGVYLLSYLPESDVERIVGYAASQGKRSFLGLMPSNAYGSVVEGAFKQAVARRGGRVTALEHYERRGRIAEAVRALAPAANGADSFFMPDGGEPVGEAVAAFAAAGVDLRQFALLGTQLWDDPRIFANPALEGGWYPAPDPVGFRGFAERYRARYGAEPPRPAALAYDAVALVAALVKTQPAEQRFSAEVLTNPSGFAGVDGVFRFRRDGTNQRGLAVLQVRPSGGEIIAAPPRTFEASGI